MAFIPVDGPAVYRLEQSANADRELGVVLQWPDGTSVDLTNAALVMSVRADIAGALLLQVAHNTSTLAGSALNVTAATDGAFSIVLKAADILGLIEAGKSARHAVYDIVLTDQSGHKSRIMKGALVAERGVTL